MSINIIVGARFNASLAANTLVENDIDFSVYSSSIRKNWPVKPENYNFIPMPSLLAARGFGLPRTSYLKELDANIFDFLASKTMKHKKILHGWASFCLRSATLQKQRGGYVILDRACPHIKTQRKILKKESQNLGIEFNEISDAMVSRMEAEYKIADIIIVPSKYTYNSFIEEGVNEDKLRIAKLDANFKPHSSSLSLQSNTQEIFTIGAIGGKVLRKGFIYLLRAWEKLNSDNAKLILKTSKKELKKFPEIINILSRNRNIEIIGYLDNIEDFYAKCDVFCLPSIDDGFGMVVMEALACGKPVLTTKNVGASEFINNFENGFVYDHGNIELLMYYISTLNEDRELLQDMKRNSKLSYEKYKSSKSTYSKCLMNIYGELL